MKHVEELSTHTISYCSWGSEQISRLKEGWPHVCRVSVPSGDGVSPGGNLESHQKESYAVTCSVFMVKRNPLGCYFSKSVLRHLVIYYGICFQVWHCVFPNSVYPYVCIHTLLKIWKSLYIIMIGLSYNGSWLYVSFALSTLPVLSYLILKIILQGRFCYSHFTDAEAKS